MMELIIQHSSHTLSTLDSEIETVQDQLNNGLSPSETEKLNEEMDKHFATWEKDIKTLK